MRPTGALVRLIAFLAVTTLTAAFLGLTLAESRGTGPRNDYTAVLANASFLKDGDEVRIAGIPVGSVKNVTVQPDRTVSVVFDAAGSTPLPEGVQALVRYKNLLGDRYLELRQGVGDPNRTLPPGGTIPLERTTPAVDLDALVGGFRPLFQALQPQQINQLSGELIAVFDGQGDSVARLLGTIASLTSSLADRDQVIGSLITNLNATLETVDERDAQLSDLVDQLQHLVTGLAADREPIGQAVTHINEVAGSTSALLRDIRPDAAGSIASLGNVAGTLNANNDDLTKALAGLGPTYESIAGIGVYGDFFNFYLCDVRVKVTGPDGQDVYSPWVESQVPRCDGRPVNGGNG
jgi:phospholipid/cholesterol/gamma-HCH transport system substrate-binding protein